MSALDRDNIEARLREIARSWVPKHFPNGRQVGTEWRLANIHGDAPRKNGSCIIHLTGQRAGDWHEFDDDSGGGPFSTLIHATGLRGHELFDHARDLVGEVALRPKRLEPRRNAMRDAMDILKECLPLRGSLAEAYLEGRGLNAAIAKDLHFHPSLFHNQTHTHCPSLIAAVRNVRGEITGIHRTYLQRNSLTVDKALVAQPRMMLGKMNGGSVHLVPLLDGSRLALCEGIETGLAVVTAVKNLSIWACLSTSGLINVILPSSATTIVILGDNDVAGRKAAENIARRLRGEGRNVVIATPPRVGDDFNDVLRRDGPGAIAEILKETDATAQSAGETQELSFRHGVPLAFPDLAQASRKKLQANEGNLEKAVQGAWTALRRTNDPPWLYRASGSLVWLERDDSDRPILTNVNEERLRLVLAQVASWVKVDRNGEGPAHPPMSVVRAMLATPNPDLPILSGIVTTPVFVKSGELCVRPGYHRASQLFYSPPSNFDLPKISANPTDEEVGAARALLLDELFVDFPFTGPAESAHAVALLLLGFVRPVIDGPTPLHLIEKPSPGTGATLLVDAISAIQTGGNASVMAEAANDDECRKRITAKLLTLPRFVVIDNIRHRLESSSLAAVLTTTEWEDRQLGASQMLRLTNRAIWIATGNNPRLSNEMARRVVRIRLDARRDQPWRRNIFRHPDLLSWIRARRSDLVAACLTLCSAWFAAGCPEGGRKLGSYEEYASVLGGILAVAKVDGFLANVDELMQTSDDESMAWRPFVSAWWEEHGEKPVKTWELAKFASRCDPPLPLGTDNEQSQLTRLGKLLARMRDRVFDLDGVNVCIQVAGTSHHARLWRLAEQPKF